ncbi:MAG: transposase [Planctomycetes bacterium]|nr:transposase [Planctomycetota bacterium]
MRPTRFDKRKYGQRWQCETVNSMIKRLVGSALRARTYWRQCREITLRAITLNVMILWHQIGAFLKSTPDAFVPAIGILQSAI